MKMFINIMRGIMLGILGLIALTAEPAQAGINLGTNSLPLARAGSPAETASQIRNSLPGNPHDPNAVVAGIIAHDLIEEGAPAILTDIEAVGKANHQFAVPPSSDHRSLINSPGFWLGIALTGTLFAVAAWHRLKTKEPRKKEFPRQNQPRLKPSTRLDHPPVV